MSSKRRRPGAGSDNPARYPTGANQARQSVGAAGGETAGMRARIGLLIVAIVLVSVVVILADAFFGAITNQGGSSAQTGTPVASSSQLGDLMPHQLADQSRP